MEVELVVHERIMRRHPELSEEDVKHAWRNAFVMQRRWQTDPSAIAVMGPDNRGRVVEAVGLLLENGGVLIYHAQTPPTQKTLIELGMR
ncbi:MAG: hypothetical protein IJ125_00995 [Atopobiaceae bacterium]|nr:hypothetical protein [Atopobiaceae bacterium]